MASIANTGGNRECGQVGNCRFVKPLICSFYPSCWVGLSGL